jgi:hypothetical protein
MKEWGKAGKLKNEKKSAWSGEEDGFFLAFHVKAD